MISSFASVLPLVAASVGFQGNVTALIFTQGSLQCAAIRLGNFQHTFAQNKPENCTLDYIVDSAGTLHDPPPCMAA